MTEAQDRAVAAFFAKVVHVDEDRRAVHTADGCVFDYERVRDLNGYRWTVLKLGEGDFIPFSLSDFEAKGRPAA